jgi:hypothetical protein
MAPLGNINPNFAKAVYTFNTPAITVPDTIFIRTDSQWENLNAMLPGYPSIMTDFTIDDSRYIASLLAALSALSDEDLESEIGDDEDEILDEIDEVEEDPGEEEQCEDVECECEFDCKNPDVEEDDDDESDIESDNGIDDESTAEDEGDDNDLPEADDQDLHELYGRSSIDLTENAIVTINIITLFGGGYGFTKTKIFKDYLRISNAKAVRKINEYNTRKKGRGR